MNTQNERKAYEETAEKLEGIEFRHLVGISFNSDTNTYEITGEMWCEELKGACDELNGGWRYWQAAKAHEAKKLEGCVAVPEAEHKEMAQFKDIYKRAIVNAKKRKNQINWAHVAGLGVGSGRAVELCKELKIDPYATDMNAMLEAARGGNE